MPTRFRKAYRELSADERRTVQALKEKAEEIERLLEQSDGDARNVALALTKLEELSRRARLVRAAVMWGTKALT